MIGKKSKRILVSLFLVGLLIIPIFCLAKTEDDSGKSNYGLLDVAKQAYGGTPQNIMPFDIIGRVLGLILAGLGVMFLLQIIIAGISWMLASGNEEKITKAKNNLIHSTIGLLIVIGAYAVTNFVMNALVLIVTSNS